MSTKPYRVLHMDAEDCIAVIRFDGDPDVFTALAWAHCIDEGIEYAIAPPEPRLYRCNPDWTREYSWLLYPAKQGGHGVWLGAKVMTSGEWFKPSWWDRAFDSWEGAA